MLSLPVMVRYRYDHQLAAGVIVASGTLAQLVPPSLVLIVLSQFIPISVGQLFAGALIPGLMLVGLYMAWLIFVAITNPRAAPPIPTIVTSDRDRPAGNRFSTQMCSGILSADRS